MCVCVSVCVCAGAWVNWVYVCFAIARHRDSVIVLISYARVYASACVYVCVCMKKVPGCSPNDADIISDRKQAFSRMFGKRTDGRTNGRTDPLIEMRGRI